MIYLWHNTTLGIYEMGNQADFAVQKSLHDVTSVYEFKLDELRFAEKILTNLNRASGEKKLSLAVA